MIGYCVQIMPQLASFRFRVAIPSRYLDSFVIGEPADVTFFYKHHPDDRKVAERCGKVVFDVVNDHFIGAHRQHYLEMCRIADVITCGSEAMAKIILDHTWKQAVVIDDPYENSEQTPEVAGKQIVWFGHQANLDTLRKVGEIANLNLCTGELWTLANERACLREAAVILLTGKPTASSNRVVKALRAGRFVVTPSELIGAWNKFRDFIWIGDVREGIAWAMNNREDACSKIKAGQHYVRQRFSPETIGNQWRGLFDSISDRAIIGRKAGSG